MKKMIIVSLSISLLALAFLTGAEAIARTYTTNFPLTENPISEGDNWINGGTTGLDWKNFASTTGLAYGKPNTVTVKDRSKSLIASVTTTGGSSLSLSYLDCYSEVILITIILF